MGNTVDLLFVLAVIAAVLSVVGLLVLCIMNLIVIQLLVLQTKIFLLGFLILVTK